MIYFRHILIILAIGFVFEGFAQKAPKYSRYFAKDQLSFSFISSRLIGQEDDIGLSAFSRGINLQMMYPVLGSKRNVSIAVGFGLACQNYYLDSFINYNADSLWFTQIPDSLNVKKYKLSTNYVVLPLELRFRTSPDNNNKSWKIYPGFRIGMLINNHTKYVGRDVETNEKFKEKQYYIKHIETFDYGLTLRVGKGKFMLNGYYSLSSLLVKDKGYDLTPIEIGLTLVLF